MGLGEEESERAREIKFRNSQVNGFERDGGRVRRMAFLKPPSTLIVLNAIRACARTFTSNLAFIHSSSTTVRVVVLPSFFLYCVFTLFLSVYSSLWRVLFCIYSYQAIQH